MIPFTRIASASRNSLYPWQHDVLIRFGASLTWKRSRRRCVGQHATLRDNVVKPMGGCGVRLGIRRLQALTTIGIRWLAAVRRLGEGKIAIHILRGRKSRCASMSSVSDVARRRRTSDCGSVRTMQEQCSRTAQFFEKENLRAQELFHRHRDGNPAGCLRRWRIIRVGTRRATTDFHDATACQPAPCEPACRESASCDRDSDASAAHA